MVTNNQLLKYPRRPKRRTTNVPALKGSPQRKGICLKVYTMSPKKPNSANRKVARVRLFNGNEVLYGKQNLKNTPIPTLAQPLLSSCVASALCNPLFCFRTRVSSTTNFEKSQLVVWRDTWNLKDKWTRGLGTTFFHNIQFSALIPLTEYLHNPKHDTLTTTICKTAVAKTIVGTLWYPSEVYRSERRMGSNISPFKFLTHNNQAVFWRGYGIFLLRTVPQTALALGGALWLSDK